MLMQTPQPPGPGPSVYFGSGRRIDAFNFDADDLPPPLLGRAMSRTNRFGGNGDRAMNIAQHSYNLSFQVGECIHRQRAALIHDCPEIFTGEIPRPVKHRCPELMAIDARILARFAEVYGVPAWAFEAIKEADSRISYDERLFMFEHMEDHDRQTALDNQLGIHIVPVTPEIAAVSWTRRFYRLFKEDLS